MLALVTSILEFIAPLTIRDFNVVCRCNLLVGDFIVGKSQPLLFLWRALEIASSMMVEEFFMYEFVMKAKIAVGHLISTDLCKERANPPII